MEKKTEWRFRIPQSSEINQDPIEGEFFTTSDVGDFADALVRESIQNSLDAALPGNESTVKTRFFFSELKGNKDLSLKNHKLFEGLEVHLNAKDNGLDKRDFPRAIDPIPYLVFEDFNTVGLDGDILENDDPGTDSPLGHNFYWFWRNIGRTGKKGTEMGKWGLGKTVFPASSLINSFFGLTNRFDDKNNYLMGLSVLKTHHTLLEPNCKRYPYGYYGTFVDIEDAYFATPTDNELLIKEFKNNFNCARRNNESGLSIVIPFPRKEITFYSILKSAIKQYFYAIITNKLIVEIVDDEMKREISIDQYNIFSILKEIQFPPELDVDIRELEKLMSLCKWGLMHSGANVVQLNDPPLDKTISWRKEWFVTAAVEKILQDKREEFEEEKRIIFKVPVKIYNSNKQAIICYFKILLEKDSLLNESDSHFVRNRITITGVKKPRTRNIRAIVIIEDKNLVKLLGDAENPAHTEWQKGSSHFRGKYQDGDKVIAFIEKSVDNICNLLIKPAEGIDKDLLKDLFFIELNAEAGTAPHDTNDPGTESDNPKPDPIPKKVYPFKLVQKKDGFRITRNLDFYDFEGQILVETGYVLSRGNPLKNYKPYDFNVAVSPINIITKDLDNLKLNNNKILFDVKRGSNFSLEAIGFDEKRDLYIKVLHYD